MYPRALRTSIPLRSLLSGRVPGSSPPCAWPRSSLVLHACSSSAGGPTAPRTANAAPTRGGHTRRDASSARWARRSVRGRGDGPRRQPADLRVPARRARRERASVRFLRKPKAPPEVDRARLRRRQRGHPTMVGHGRCGRAASAGSEMVVTPDSGSAPLQVAISVAATDEDGPRPLSGGRGQPDGNYEYDARPPAPARTSPPRSPWGARSACACGSRRRGAPGLWSAASA